MIVEFQTNLGSADATRLDLDFAKCRMGCVVEVSSPVGEALVRRQLAADVTPQPVKVEEPIVEPIVESPKVEEPIVEPTPVPAPVPVKESKKQKNDSTPNK